MGAGKKSLATLNPYMALILPALHDKPEYGKPPNHGEPGHDGALLVKAIHGNVTLGRAAHLSVLYQGRAENLAKSSLGRAARCPL